MKKVRYLPRIDGVIVSHHNMVSPENGDTLSGPPPLPPPLATPLVGGTTSLEARQESFLQDLTLLRRRIYCGIAGFWFDS